MRLWHKDLIQVLPRQQLLGQWRECVLIAKLISEKGTPNHVIVNRVMEYPKDHFYTYCKLVQHEMAHRGYRMSYEATAKIFHEYWDYIDPNEIFKNWHNKRYLNQCLANLQEKYDCGTILKDEWKQITDKWPEYT